MTAPKRIQLRRTKGWRMPEGAMSVARPTRWGNPYVVGDPVEMSYQGFCDGSVGFYTPGSRDLLFQTSEEVTVTAELAVRFYRENLTSALTPFVLDGKEPEADRERRLDLVGALLGLAGRDLGCFCAVSAQWCHADILLNWANNYHAFKAAGVLGRPDYV